MCFLKWLQVVENWKYGGPCRDHRREQVNELLKYFWSPPLIHFCIKFWTLLF